MNESMLPLAAPPMEYLTRGPWLVSFEWVDGRFHTTKMMDFGKAVFAFWGSMTSFGPFGSHSAPNRRCLVDARGVTILGCLDRVPTEVPVVATQEVLDKCENLGLDSVQLLSLEMEIRWNNLTQTS